MYLIFLNHQWKEFWRGKNKAGNIVVKILIGFIILYFLVLAVAAGLFMKELIGDIFPKKEPVVIFNGFIFYYFLADFLMRMQFQDLPTISVEPYLHLNIRKKVIVNFLNIISVFSAFNVLPLILFLPFSFTTLLQTYAAAASII